ncbi:hypothetical protein J2W42_002199 [Rhizobium tibeticum]|uniref:phage tail tape-measure protein n=1 Tax=Rhizobium tibeticum TaxID=501024 RepID=UPI00278049FC|nr:phage tail tape-measure protein [Rhizobium tibeticum]MDP9809351.1 hypothetical protein [Rhizobium tibeticum]
MADVAALGISVTQKGTKEASSDLDQLRGAASRAEAATNGLSSASQGASGAASAAAQAYAKQGAAAAQTSKQIELMNKAANGNGQIRMMAMQLSQVAQQTQATGNFMQALAIQLPDLALGFGTVGIAVGVLLGVLLPLIDAPKYVASGLRLVADNLEVIAPYAVGAAAGLALLYAPSIIAGMYAAATSIGTVATAVWGVAIAIYATVGLPALLVAGFTAMVAAAVIFRDELTNILGVDIVGVAKTGANYIIGSFVAAYHDIQFLWEQFPNLIGSVVIGAVNATVKAIADMIQKAAGLIDGFSRKANEWLPERFQIGEIGDLSFGDVTIPNDYTTKVQDAVTKRNKQLQADLSNDYLGNFASGVAEYAGKGADALKNLATWMEKVDQKTKKKNGKTEAEKYDDIVDGANRRIASLQAEQDALGMTEQAALKLRYETDLLNQAQQRGITLTDAQKTELSGLADRMASIEVATKNAREAMDFAKDSTRGFLDDLRYGLESGEGLWKSFGNAALGVLDRIISKINEQLVDAIFSASSTGSGGRGFWSSLLGIFGGGGASQLSIAQAGGVGLYASGTPAARPGVAWVGEKGPELVRFKGGEEVIPNHRLQVPANQNGSEASGDVHITIAPTFNAANADESAIASLRNDFNKFRADVPSTIVDTVKNAQRRRLL